MQVELFLPCSIVCFYSQLFLHVSCMIIHNNFVNLSMMIMIMMVIGGIESIESAEQVQIFTWHL